MFTSRAFAIAIVCFLGIPLCGAGAASDALESGFFQPPSQAKPRVWWHWANGNITTDGIQRDLDWLHSVGIGGVNVVDVAYLMPQVVDKRLVFMTPGWKNAFRFAAETAGKYGMEFGIDSSPGWSETGGPWVTPQQAMKKLVWSATFLDGGRRFHAVLPVPPSNAGPIQNVPIAYSSLGEQAKSQSVRLYGDSAVVAYKLPVTPPRVVEAVSSAGPLDPVVLSDGDLTNGPMLTPNGDTKQAWIELAYSKPVLMQGMTVAIAATGAPGAAIAVSISDDRKSWRPLTEILPTKLLLHTVSFEPVKARYMRLTLSPGSPNKLLSLAATFAPGADVCALIKRVSGASEALGYQVHELVVHSTATVNEAEVKAGFTFADDNYAIATSADTAPHTAVNTSDVQVLTDRMWPAGTLDWTPPPGRWVVLRMGYSPTGQENRPASPEATGLEVDKLNRSHVRDYMQRYLGLYEETLGSGMSAVNALTLDSTEVGAQNWTENMLAEFRRLHGYDASPWLPALTGVVIGSPAQTDKFLWDFRRTIAELTAQNHYGEVTAAAHEKGLSTYVEALEDYRSTPTFGDDMEMRRDGDIPMAAMWAYGEGQAARPVFFSDIMGAASVADIYGRNLVAAESLTSIVQFWTQAPRHLKPTVDLEFALGVNRIVIHSSVHQPMEKAPGLAMLFGQYFNRHDTWARDAKPWIDYIARSSYLLQQGRPVKDIAFFYGEEGPITGQFNDHVAEVPSGYGFDFVNAGALLHQFSVGNGDLIAKSGMRYRVLYLSGTSRFMTMTVLRRIRDLVSEGLVLVGRRPEASPSLSDDPAAFNAAVGDLFGKPGETGTRAYGKGLVFLDGSLEQALAAIKLEPDFEHSKTDSDTKLMALHRRLEKGELYFVSNRSNRPEQVTATFRVSGLKPELWNAASGTIAPTAYRIEGGRTQVSLDLLPYDSVFVVFRGSATSQSAIIAKQTETVVSQVDGPWRVAFQPDRGAPVAITLAKLQSWTENSAQDVKYFSGQGTYTTSLTIPAVPKNARLLLDLGDVREIAAVEINGKRVGTAWMPPFKLDITSAVRRGKNRLTIRVTDLWVNRLIGDAQPGADKKYTFTTIPTYKPDAPLRPSGLLGPVRIVQCTGACPH